LWTQRRGLPAAAPRPADTEVRNAFDLFRIVRVRHILITSGLISMAWDMQTFLVPVYGTSVGLSASQIGLVLGSFAAATFVIRLAMPRLALRFNEWQVIVFTLLTAAMAFGFMPFFDTMLPMAAVTFLLGLGLGAAQPNVMSLIHARTPEGRVGEALGVRTTLMNGSHVVLPLVFGAFGSVLGAGAAFWLIATALASGGWTAHRRWSKHEVAR